MRTHSLSLLLLGVVGLFGCGAAPEDLSSVEETPGQTQQAVCSPWKQVAAGTHHTCAINTSNHLYCWGRNNLGQLGDGTTTDRATPVFISYSISHVYASGWTTCAIADANHSTSPGNLLCWGYNNYKQVRDTTNTYYSTPVAATGLTLPIKKASVGLTNVCVIDNSNYMRCWGDRSSCQDGVAANTTPTHTAWTAPSLSMYDWWPAMVGEVSTGVGTICGSANGTLGINTPRCWGRNDNGQLGTGARSSYSCTPIEFNVPWKTEQPSNMTAANGFTCASPIDGTYRPRCVGYNYWGTLGRNYATKDGWYDQLDIASVFYSMNIATTRTLTNDTGNWTGALAGNALWTWGGNFNGSLGQGYVNETDYPVRMQYNGVNISASNAAGNGSHGCAVETNGARLFCWGENTFGQVGDGTTTHRVTPVPVPCL